MKAGGVPAWFDRLDAAVAGWMARHAITLLRFLQLPGTVMPLVLFPAETFTRVPFAPTLEGQYIIKNLVLAAAALAVGATVRGGRLQAEPGRP